MNSSIQLHGHAKAVNMHQVEVVRLANLDSESVKVHDIREDAIFPLTKLFQGPFYWIAHEDRIGAWDGEEKEVTIKIFPCGAVELNGERTDLEIYIPR